MSGCKKCTMMCGWSLLVFGVLFLLRDLGYYNFWNVQWYTVLFLLWGVGSVAMTKCPDCMAMRQGMMSKKK